MQGVTHRSLSRELQRGHRHRGSHPKKFHGVSVCERPASSQHEADTRGIPFTCLRNFLNLMKQVVEFCEVTAGARPDATEAAVLLLGESNAKVHSEFVCLGAAASDYTFKIFRRVMQNTQV